MAAKEKSVANRGDVTPPKKGSAHTRDDKPPPPSEPVLSGRLIWVLAMFVAMLAIPFSPLREVITKTPARTTKQADWKAGTKGTIHLTVVTADYDNLSCASAEQVEGKHCAFESETKSWPKAPEAPVDDNKKDIIQPYRTTEGQLVMVAGLWAQPEVAWRLHEEPPRGVAENKLARFVVECDVRFVQEWQQPKLRWAPSQKWSQQGNAMIAIPESCRVLQRKSHES